MFDALSRLYRQGHLLLLDSDRLMDERGWTTWHNYAVAELSYSVNTPQRWFARWATRFYLPAMTETDESFFSEMLFVSIHFASDPGSGMETHVDDPIICAGRLLYEKPVLLKDVNKAYAYWMCKYWFVGEPHPTLAGWRQTGQSRWYKNLRGSETFSVPLYSVTSADRLTETVIAPLLAVQNQDRSDPGV
jgi:hypothetical protein